MTCARLMLAVLLACPTMAAAEPANVPVSEALVDRFIATLPDSGQSGRLDRTPDPEELRRIAALNPGREDVVRTVLANHQGCLSSLAVLTSLAAMRDTARRLGREKLQRLIDFYTGADFVRFKALKARRQTGPNLSAAEAAEMAGFLVDYRLIDFYATMQGVQATLARDPQFVGSVRACRDALGEALAREKLRQPN